MKRKERRHLRENELAQTIAAARAAIESRKKLVTGLLLAAVVVAAVAGGIIVWRQEGNARAQQALGDAMVIFNARVIPATASPDQPGAVPAAATLEIGRAHV